MSVVPLKMSLPSTLPWKLSARPSAAARSSSPALLDRLAALDRFFADVEQADARLVLAVDRADQRAAHHRELQQVLGACSRRWRRGRARSCSRRARSASRWRSPGGRCRRASSARSATTAISAPVLPAETQACASDGRSASRLDLARSRRAATNPSCGAAPPRPSRPSRRPRSPRRGVQRAQPCGRRQRVGAADEHQLGLRMRGEEGPARRQRDRRAVIAAHAVDGQADRRGGSGRHGGRHAADRQRAVPGSAAVDASGRLRRPPWSSAPCGRGRSRSG